LNELYYLVGKSGLSPELNQAVNAGWSRYYGLKDAARMLDKSMSGVSGQTAVSQAQRGIDGKILLRGVDRLVQSYVGKQAVDKAVGIPGAVDSWEAIGNATKTVAGRKAVNAGIASTAQFIFRRAMGLAGAKVGYATAGPAGGFGGYVAGETAAVALQRTTEKVYRAILTNPQAAQNLLFAIHSGAQPEKWIPTVAALIDKHETETSRERQAEESNEGNEK
jgi:hypothetical protein